MIPARAQTIMIRLALRAEKYFQVERIMMSRARMQVQVQRRQLPLPVSGRGLSGPR